MLMGSVGLTRRLMIRSGVGWSRGIAIMRRSWISLLGNENSVLCLIVSGFLMTILLMHLILLVVCLRLDSKPTMRSFFRSSKVCIFMLLSASSCFVSKMRPKQNSSQISYGYYVHDAALFERHSTNNCRSVLCEYHRLKQISSNSPALSY